MKPSPQWIVTRVDGKIASVSMSYVHLAKIAGKIAGQNPSLVSSVTTEKISTQALVELAKAVRWEDLVLYGRELLEDTGT